MFFLSSFLTGAIIVSLRARTALTSAMVWLIWIWRISFTARISATWRFAAFVALAAKVGWRRWKRKVRARGRVENMMN